MKWVRLILVVFILSDLGYSFYAYYHTPLDGDLSEVVMPFPFKGYYSVLKDPFGIEVLETGKTYPNPNRFFAHYTASTYFKNAPRAFRAFSDPVSSVYYAAASIKLLVHLALMLLIARMASGTWRILDNRFLTAAALITALFQAAGFNRYMGVIDQSVTYVFFYALTMVYLLLLILPFYRYYFEKGKEPSRLMILVVFMVAPLVTLNGPLIPGIVLILATMSALILFSDRSWKRIRIPKDNATRTLFVSLFFLAAWSLYSLFLGTFNSLNEGTDVGLLQRYIRLPMGLFNILTTKMGMPLLIIGCGINLFLLRKRSSTDEWLKVRQLVSFLLGFILLYVLLLPLGGFRSYREMIIRYDTFLPVVLICIFVYSLTTVCLIRLTSLNSGYVIFPVALIVVFTFADQQDVSGQICEQKILGEMTKQTSRTWVIDKQCPVMGWTLYMKPEESIQNAALIHYWGITDHVLLYSHASGDDQFEK